MPNAGRTTKAGTKTKGKARTKTKAKTATKTKAKAATKTKPKAKPTGRAAAKSTKRNAAKTSKPNGGESAARLIEARIEELGDWRGAMLSRIRELIRQADPDVVEEWKWSVPVWSHDGLICTGETYKSVVKMTFASGAALADPAHLFNSSLEGNTRRAIDFREGEAIDEQALKTLIRAAVALNVSHARR
jgi:hypothetical protein